MIEEWWASMVGKRLARFWAYIEFIVDSDPTLPIWGEKKIIL